MEHESDGDTNCNRCTWNNSQRMDKGTRRHRNQRTGRDHPDYSIVKIGQNTEKSPGDLRKTFCHSNYSEKLSANVGVKNSEKSKIKIKTKLYIYQQKRKKEKENLQNCRLCCLG